MPINTPKRLDHSTPSHARAKKQESELATRLGGKVQKGSGCGQYQKGDVKVKRVALIEAKTTKHNSFRVTMETLDKLEADSFGSGVVPVLAVELALGAKKVYVVPDWALEGILGIEVAPSSRDS